MTSAIAHAMGLVYCTLSMALLVPIGLQLSVQTSAQLLTTCWYCCLDLTFL
jgi:hypothetical protein